jgi:hypothetical protein
VGICVVDVAKTVGRFLLEIVEVCCRTVNVDLVVFVVVDIVVVVIVVSNLGFGRGYEFRPMINSFFLNTFL